VEKLRKVGKLDIRRNRPERQPWGSGPLCLGSRQPAGGACRDVEDGLFKLKKREFRFKNIESFAQSQSPVSRGGGFKGSCRDTRRAPNGGGRAEGGRGTPNIILSFGRKSRGRPSSLRFKNIGRRSAKVG